MPRFGHDSGVNLVHPPDGVADAPSRCPGRDLMTPATEAAGCKGDKFPYSLEKRSFLQMSAGDHDTRILTKRKISSDVEPVEGSLSSTWWKFILGINLFFVCVTVIFTYLPFFPLSERYLRPLNLALEMNIAAWWSGVIIFLAGVMAYEVFSTGTKISSIAWLSISIILVGLSYDEICSIHERVGSFKGYIPYASILFLLFLFSFSVLFLNIRTRKSAVLIGCGFMMYGLVALQEYLEHIIIWPYYLKGIRVGVEEGTELMGTLIILFGVLPQRRIKFNRVSSFSFLPLIPYVSIFKGFRTLFIGAAMLNTIAALSICPLLDVPGLRGSLSIWYPTMLFLLFALAFLLEAQNTSGLRKNILYGLFGLFILSSMNCMYPLYLFIPKITRLIPKKILENVNVIFVFQLLGLLLYHKMIKPLLTGQIISMLLIIAVTSVSLFTNIRMEQLQMLSISSVFAAIILTIGNYSAKK